MMECFMAYNGGLGDHILMNGAVRHFAKIYDRVHVMAFRRTVTNVNHMFRDDPNIVIHCEPDANSPMQSNKKVRTLNNRFARAGCDIKSFYWGYMAHWPGLLKRIGMDPNKNCWCEGFYHVLGVPYHERYKSWKFVRDHERENNLYELLNLPDEYVFVVNRYGGGNQRRRTFTLSIDDVSNYGALPHVNPAPLVGQTLIYDWMKVIENAKEVHVVDTAWMHLVRQMLLKQPKFLHRSPGQGRHVPASDANYLNDQYDSGWTDVQ